MRKMARLLVVICALLPLTIYSATRNANSDGNWGVTGTWQGGVVPTAADNVTFANNTDVTIVSPNAYTILSMSWGNSCSLTINSGGSLVINGNFSAPNGGTLIVNGNLTINGNLIVGNQLDLIVSGTLIINGNVQMNNGGTLQVNSSGNVDINGSFTGGNDSDLIVNGNMDISGTLDLQGNQSSVTGSGSFSFGGCPPAEANETWCQQATALPIKLLFFNGQSVNATIELKWATYEEENFSHFILEKSSNGLDWAGIAEIDGKGWSTSIINYNHIDYNPIVGTAYYRLKAIDFDGSFEYHNVIAVQFRGNALGFEMFPNPSDGTHFDLQLNFRPNGPVKVIIYDLKGTLLFEGESDGFMTSIVPTVPFGNGMYHVQVTTSDGMQIHRKLLVR